MSYNLSKIEHTFDFNKEIGIWIPLPLNPLHDTPIYISNPNILK